MSKIDGCIDTNEDSEDKSNFGCERYNNLLPYHCGIFDDEDFNANKMCCACGGGRYGISLSYCFNSNKVKTLYIVKIMFYKNVNISPHFLGKCVNFDENKTDREGRDCDAYSESLTVLHDRRMKRRINLKETKYHDNRCGKYDDEDFDSVEMCCNCGGGGFGNFMFCLLIIFF